MSLSSKPSKTSTESPKVKPSKTTTTTTTTTKSQKKKPPVNFLDPNKAPGKDFSEYQFPEIDYEFPLGLSQSLKWFELVRFARGSNDDATANTESESKKRKKNPSGYYRTYECPALDCEGMFKVKSAGKQQPATVNFSKPCTCPLRKKGKDVTKESYHVDQLLIRDLFLYLIEAKDAHIVNMVTVSRDGSRNNGKKKHVSFLSSDNRLFFCTIAKTGENLFKLLKIEESNAPVESTATITSPSVENETGEVANKATKSCTLCFETTTTLYRLSCTCRECEENPYCSKCLTSLYKRRTHPFNHSWVDFETEQFAVVNDKAGSCPHCQKFSVTKFVPVGGGQDEALDLPLPYGWIGDHAFMTKAEYDSAFPIFEASIMPYFMDYNIARFCFASAEQQLQTANASDSEKRDLGVDKQMFGELIKFCAKKMYHEVKWVQNCSEVVPAAETIVTSVSGRTEFAKVEPEKANLLNKLLLKYTTKQNKENIQPRSNH